jgi:hypothetical protein
MVNNSTNIITTNNHLSLNKRKITTFDVGNPIPGLGQAQNYGRVSLFVCFKQYIVDKWKKMCSLKSLNLKYNSSAIIQSVHLQHYQIVH